MATLKDKYGEATVSRDGPDVVGHVPEGLRAVPRGHRRYGDVSKLPTRAFIEPMELGEEIAVELEKGKMLGIKLNAVGLLDPKSGTREVFFDFNGMPRSVKINDRTAQPARSCAPRPPTCPARWARRCRASSSRPR